MHYDDKIHLCRLFSSTIREQRKFYNFSACVQIFNDVSFICALKILLKLIHGDLHIIVCTENSMLLYLHVHAYLYSNIHIIVNLSNPNL